jgi:hypothetical protein
MFLLHGADAEKDLPIKSLAELNNFLPNIVFFK